ncbi:two-component system sensor histidine kinase YesM [Paenibacillus endophyticus]|uniref:histidine kinase n=1 Tax=Paenibacillus endophyticus TaxID=1294268 RepID=A0A7W5C978_9BACL|nr:histidine kinase [Paenibacillus endophyticus]MBB3153466.1 two-component system sensor histidine kinase YesM [Paenibacillus endophyticus]
MEEREGSYIKRLFGWDTLRGQLYWTLLISSVIPLVLVGLLTVYSIYNILYNKIEKGIEQNLQRVRGGVEETLGNLYDVSQQMSYQGFVGQDLKLLQTSEDTYEKSQLTTAIQRNMGILNASNPTIGLVLYYDTTTGEMLYNNYITRNPHPDFDSLPKLSIKSDHAYNGPHLTLYKYNDTSVFSIVRSAGGTTDPRNPMLVYAETNVKVIQNVLNKEQYGMNVSHLLMDNDGVVLYSDKPELTPIGSRYDAKTMDHYYFHEEIGSQGWRLGVFIEKGEYQKEIRDWFVRYSFIVVLGLLISIWSAFRTWKVVIAPLHRIRKGISSFISQEPNDFFQKTGLREFDFLIDNFKDMQFKIQDLIEEVAKEASEKQDIEMEKLMAQINPHFLYNTLNTAQWLARLKGQHEIDRFLSLFTKVLKYNLAKDGTIVTLKDEIDSLNDYVELQKIRYDFEFDVRYDIPEPFLATPLPRFILQPIVENALYHGMMDEKGVIEVSVQETSQALLLKVTDNGNGISPEKIKELLESDTRKNNLSGLGIGLNYVKRTLSSFTGGSSELAIDSEIGKGTVVSIHLPIDREGNMR